MKDLGEQGELEFLVAAKRKGLNPSTPYSDNLRYDVIVDNGRKLYRVQVKTIQAASSASKNTIKYRGTATHGASRGKAQYTPEDCDFIAFWVAPLDTWYIVPITEMTTKRINLRPHLESAGYHEKFKEAWNLLLN